MRLFSHLAAYTPDFLTQLTTPKSSYSLLLFFLLWWVLLCNPVGLFLMSDRQLDTFTPFSSHSLFSLKYMYGAHQTPPFRHDKLRQKVVIYALALQCMVPQRGDILFLCPLFSFSPVYCPASSNMVKWYRFAQSFRWHFRGRWSISGSGYLRQWSVAGTKTLYYLRRFCHIYR